MANQNNKEIEIRVRVADSAPLVTFLTQNGTIKAAKHQRDEYFAPPHKNYLEETPVKEWLRLREEGGQYSINYKNWHYNEDGKSYHCDEYEVVVDDVAKARAIFDALNMKSLIVVNKNRRTFHYNEYEVAIDSVDGLGDFVEVEYKGDVKAGDEKHVAEVMKDFVKRTGCEILSQDFTGYPFMLLKQKYGVEIK